MINDQLIDNPELFILDIGHGNCAILQDGDITTVIDCPPSSILVEVLERLGIDTINNILISHSDVDHAGGLPNLLKNIHVENIYINPDANKRGRKGKLWRGVRIALDEAEKEGTTVHPSLTTALSKKIHNGQIKVEILSPSIGVALGGAGGEDTKGRKQDSNSMSVVIGLVHDSYRVALLPGDMDKIGLDNLLNKHKDIKSDILVFPHHGGKPDPDITNCQDFASQLCDLVQPNLVIFSHGRNQFNNPRGDIMKGVVTAVPGTHVMCTQLSKKCAKIAPTSQFSHLTNLPAAGFREDICCGGTIQISINGEQTTYKPPFTAHRIFVSDIAMVPTPLCLNVNVTFQGKKKKIGVNEINTQPV